VLSDLIICLKAPYECLRHASSGEKERKEGVGGGLSDQKMQKCFPGSACDFNRELCKMDFLHHLSAVLRSLFLFTY